MSAVKRGNLDIPLCGRRPRVCPPDGGLRFGDQVAHEIRPWRVVHGACLSRLVGRVEVPNVQGRIVVRVGGARAVLADVAVVGVERGCDGLFFARGQVLRQADVCLRALGGRLLR